MLNDPPRPRTPGWSSRLEFAPDWWRDPERRTLAARLALHELLEAEIASIASLTFRPGEVVVCTEEPLTTAAFAELLGKVERVPLDLEPSTALPTGDVVVDTPNGEAQPAA